MKKVIQNLKISQKLYVLVGVALIGMLIIGGMSFSLMGKLNEKTSDISTSWLPSVAATANCGSSCPKTTSMRQCARRRTPDTE